MKDLSNVFEKKISLWDEKLSKYKVYRIIYTIIYDVFAYGLFDISAQAAFYFTLSFIPLILLTISILYAIPIPENSVNLLEHLKLPTYLHSIVASTQKTTTSSIFLNFTILFFSSSGATSILIKNLKLIYAKDEYNSLFLRIISIFMNFVFVVLILLSILSITFISLFIQNLFNILNINFNHINFLNIFIIAPFIFFILFFAIYFYALPKHPKLTNLIPGSITAAVLLVVSFYSLNFYLLNFKDYSSYGILATLIILMLYFFVTSFIIFFGAIINKYFYDKQRIIDNAK